MFTVDGLISGLDTATIVEGALALQQSRIDRLAIQKQEIVEEQTAFKTVEGQLFGLQGSLRNILRSSNNAFDSKIATSSDEEAVEVSASSSAVAGTYKFQVIQLSQAHQIKSNGFSTESEEIAQGTLTFQVGGRAEATVTIDASNNTLQGLADAINSQTTDVSAAIVNDGSGSATPLRLLVTARHSGSDHQIQITNNLAGGSGTQPDFTGPAVQDAADAQVQIGSGAGAITVSSSENQFDDLLPGITLDVLRANPGTDITITVSEDTAQVVDAIDGFVNAYNDVIEFIDSNSTYDTESNTAGLLLGNRTAASVQSTLRAALGQVVDGVNDNLRTLSSVGISTTSAGKLTLNRSRLEDITSGRVEGVGIDDIRRLFAIDGQSDNPGIAFVLGTNNTQASPKDPATGSLLPYEVEINGAASRANLIGGTPLAGTSVIDASNDTFDIEIDGIELTLTIPQGSYTPTELAEQLETLINTSPDRAGRQSLVEVIGGSLSITSVAYGSSSSLEVLSGNANTILGLTSGTTDVGTDVAGVFRVQLPGGGTITEQATGNGRLLASNADNEYTAQLQVRSSLVEGQISANPDAHMTVTRGIGAALDAALDELLDPTIGALSNTQDRFTRQIEAIDQSVERAETQLELRREALLLEFASLESTLAEIQSAGNALSSSLGVLSL